jgi:hypothetical protein
MATIRSFDKPFEVTDLTEELLLVPNTWGLVNEMGVFRTEGVTQHSITIEESSRTLSVITDQPRGARNSVNKDDNRKIRALAVPHFPLDDYISPQDLQGKRAYGSDAAETEAAVMARKIERIRMNHAVTLEFARCKAITTGDIYAPNGTVSGNYYTEFGVTRKQVDFVLGTASTNVLEKGEEIIAHITDEILSGESVNSVTALCSPEFFAKLIKQAGVVDAYRYYTSTQEPNRARLGTGLYRRFVHGGVEYVEYRGSYNGERLIPAGDAYFLPMGTSDTFISYFSPANKFDLVNTIGEEAYMFTFRDPKNEKIEIQSEHNAIHLIRRPQVVVRAFSSN